MSTRPIVTVDRIACDGHGICAEILPERIRLDDWGYPIVDPAPIPDGLVPLARRAVRDCPALALRLRSVDAHAAPRAGGVPPRARPATS